jgi:hypothetical protein
MDVKIGKTAKTAQNWKLWAVTTGRHDFFFQNPVDDDFRTLKSSSGVKMKEIEDVYFYALYGNGQLSREMCFKNT